MQLRKYRTSDCEHLAELFYHTVHSVNEKDYTKEQLDVWATGTIDLKKWDESFLKHHTVVAVEPGETPQQALKREIMEELSTEIKVGELIDTIEYDYPTFHLSMDCFWAEVVTGQLELKEAEAAKWLTKDQLESVAWLPADITLIDKIRQYMN